MIIWDGNIRDTTNFITDKYLQINSCGYQNVPSGYTVIRKKGRQDYHILLINSGECEVLFENETYTLTKGNLVIYEPDTEQRYSFSKESSSLWCHFTGTIIKELFESCHLSGGVYLLKPNNEIFETYSTVLQRFHQPGKEKFANTSLMELIYNIAEATLVPEKESHADTILPILTYINTNYNKQISLSDLAKKSGYSKSRFSHIFSEQTGTTPLKYQNDIRLKISCEILSSTNQSISDIAVCCGFNDPLYFSRLFKNKYGMSPREYRSTLKILND